MSAKTKCPNCGSTDLKTVYVIAGIKSEIRETNCNQCSYNFYIIK